MISTTAVNSPLAWEAIICPPSGGKRVPHNLAWLVSADQQMRAQPSESTASWRSAQVGAGRRRSIPPQRYAAVVRACSPRSTSRRPSNSHVASSANRRALTPTVTPTRAIIGAWRRTQEGLAAGNHGHSRTLTNRDKQAGGKSIFAWHADICGLGAGTLKSTP